MVENAMLRDIIGKEDNEYSPEISNWYLRYGNNIATIRSQKMEDKICDINRWETSMAPEYLNNTEEFDNRVNRWIILWRRTKAITNSFKNINTNPF